MSTATSQEPLFTIDPATPEPVSGVPAGQLDPAAYDTTLTGDGYGWLAALLPATQSRPAPGAGSR
jgi:hypothetical protein